MTLFERRLRLGTGLFLTIYITQHLLNHTLGLVSYDLMEGVRALLSGVWRNPLVNGLVYACLIVHFLLALLALYRRSTLRMRPWELSQMLLGLLVIPLLAGHAISNWGARVLQGVEVDYYFTLTGIFSNDWYIVRQVLLVIVAWLHVCIGLHFWAAAEAVVPALGAGAVRRRAVGAGACLHLRRQDEHRGRQR